MVKQIIVLIVMAFLFFVGITAICIGKNEKNQTLLYVGISLNIIAFLFSYILRKKKD